MKKTILTLAAIGALSLTASAQNILVWDFFGDNSSNRPTMDSTFNVLGTSISTLSRGATAPATVGANSFRTTGFGNDGINLDNTDYFEWTLTVTEPVYNISLNSIEARFAGTPSYATNAPGGVTMAYAYSLDGGSSFTLTDTFQVFATPSAFSFDLTGISALQNLTSTNEITFRFFASGQTTTGGWGFSNTEAQAEGLVLTGTIPEPSTYALLALAGAGLAGHMIRRRRRAGH
jgi:hypothetical protein